jgi:hypothetical protein
MIGIDHTRAFRRLFFLDHDTGRQTAIKSQRSGATLYVRLTRLTGVLKK